MKYKPQSHPSKLCPSLINGTISKKLGAEGHQRDWHQCCFKLKLCSSLFPILKLGIWIYFFPISVHHLVSSPWGCAAWQGWTRRFAAVSGGAEKGSELIRAKLGDIRCPCPNLAQQWTTQIHSTPMPNLHIPLSPNPPRGTRKWTISSSDLLQQIWATQDKEFPKVSFGTWRNLIFPEIWGCPVLIQQFLCNSDKRRGQNGVFSTCFPRNGVQLCPPPSFH